MNLHSLFQYSMLEAFDKLVYDGSMTIADLRAHGDFGLGCFNALDGELIAFDGRFFHATADGFTKPAAENSLVSCVYMQRFSPLFAFSCQNMFYRNLLEAVSGVYNHIGQPFFAIRLDGEFASISVRSIPPQTKPYPPIPEIVEKQTLFDCRNVTATLVGFFFPSYVQGLTFHGFHLHFITQDDLKGGHVLDFEAIRADIKIDPIESYRLMLPDYAQLSFQTGN